MDVDGLFQHSLFFHLRRMIHVSIMRFEIPLQFVVNLMAFVNKSGNFLSSVLIAYDAPFCFGLRRFFQLCSKNNFTFWSKKFFPGPAEE